MAINNIYIHSQTALPQEYSKLLKEGSSVLVHVLKNCGNGKYVASFGGGRYSILSKQKLEAGSTFMAKISISDGKINLVKTQNNISGQSINGEPAGPIVHSQNSMTPQVAELLVSLGLPADSISKMLVQTMISAGAKINLEKINKARAIAQNFEGQEDEAAEAAMILLDKGIAPTILNVRQLLVCFKKPNCSDQNSLEKKQEIQTDYKVEQLISQIKSFFTDILSGKENFINNGFLTVYNHLLSNGMNYSEHKNSLEQKNHWVIIPFEYSFEKSQKQINGSGVFRVFFNLNEKNIKKMVINFYYNGEMWTFVVYFKGEILEKLKFSHSPQFNEKKYAQAKTVLGQYFLDADIEIAKPEELAGFASGDVLLSRAKGFA